jgi:CheY-like chemotaxis protein
VAAHVLGKAGAIIQPVHNGAEAIDAVAAGRYDLILLDCQMPVVDGFEAASAIRNRLGVGTPIIAVTAGAFDSDRERCFACGMDDFLTKPFRSEVIVAKCVEWGRRTVKA